MRLLDFILYELKISWHNLKDVFGSAGLKERIIIIIGILALIGYVVYFFYTMLFIEGI